MSIFDNAINAITNDSEASKSSFHPHTKYGLHFRNNRSASINGNTLFLLKKLFNENMEINNFI